jgi:hypothetical protein
MKQPSLLGTRRSLIERLADWGDQLRWQEFFDTYSKLIYSAACRSGLDLDVVWETEWKENLFEAAIARVKKQIEPKQLQIFDCYVRKEWPAQKVAARLGVNIGQVYLARHRVGALLKKEIKAMEKSGR